MSHYEDILKDSMLKKYNVFKKKFIIYKNIITIQRTVRGS